MQQQPTVTRTDYTGGEELTIYFDSFLKGQAVAAALIGKRLSAQGFAAANELLVEALESRHYQFHAKEDDAEEASAPGRF